MFISIIDDVACLEMLTSFDFLDSSGDNQLDYDEFSIYTKSERVFNLIDFNQDGFVDKNELRKVIGMLARTKTSFQGTTPSTTSSPKTVAHVRPVK